MGNILRRKYFENNFRLELFRVVQILNVIIYRTDSIGNLFDQTEQILSVIVRFLKFASEVKNLSLAQLSFTIALITNSLYIANHSFRISIVLARLKC